MAEQSACRNIAAIKDEPVDFYSENESGQGYMNVKNDTADLKPEIIAAGDGCADVVGDVRPPYVAAVKQELDIGLTVLQPLNVQLKMATASSNDTYVPMTMADLSSRHDPAAIKCEPDDPCSDNESGHAYVHVKSEPADVKTETIAIANNCADDVRPLVEIELTPLSPLDVPFIPWTCKQKPADDSPQIDRSLQQQHSYNSAGKQLNIRSKRFTEIETVNKQVVCNQPYSLIIVSTCNVQSLSYVQTNQFPHRKNAGERSYNCDICGKVFTRKGNLARHMNTHTGERPFSCDVCNKSFSEKGSLSVHRKIHTGERCYNCDDCGKRFAQKVHLAQHMNIHTGNRSYNCDVCSKSFTQRSNFARHKSIHAGQRSYKCNVCSKGFLQRSHLERHIRTHTGERSYNCDLCSKSFAEKGSLNKHRNIHTGELSYSCDFCNKIFMHRSSLSKHMNIHTGKRTYNCEVCNKIFTRKDYVAQHMNIHTGERSYNCGVCSKSFALKSSLNKHMNVHTG